MLHYHIHIKHISESREWFQGFCVTETFSDVLLVLDHVNNKYDVFEWTIRKMKRNVTNSCDGLLKASIT